MNQASSLPIGPHAYMPLELGEVDNVSV
jgi:hypothetical protein